jgi:uncharacterized protein YbjT (DUF2867 family)
LRQHHGVAEQVVVVVGATGAVGRATVLSAMGRGARVVAVAPDTRALDALAVEVDAPHRFETVVADLDAPHQAERITSVTTARFGLLHTWVQVLGGGANESVHSDTVAPAVFRQLRRSGGGAFVVVAPESDAPADPARRRLADLDLGLARLDVARRGRKDLVAVTLVRRTGIVAPDRVAETILRAATHPRREWIVRGSARRDALVELVAPAPVRGRLRPEGAWVLR